MKSNVAVLFALCCLGASAEPVSSGDRQRLIAHLEMTQAWLVDEVAGLSPAQLKFRPSAEAWSILDVIEHLAVAEPQYWKTHTDSLTKPAITGKSPLTDDRILWYGIDRSDRNKTGAAREPKGTLKDAQSGLDSFMKLRAEILQYTRTTQDDLRGRLIQTNAIDLYQSVLMISSHSQRHILQIREIKKNPEFPRK